MPTPDGGDDFAWVGDPGEGLWGIVGLSDEAVDGGLKIGDGSEDAAFEAPPCELGEEALDGVEPGCRGWSEAFEQALTIARETGNRMWEMLMIPTLAVTQARSGDPSKALRSFLQMLDSWHRSTDIMSVSGGIGALVLLFERLGDATAAATINGFLTRMIESNAFFRDLPDTIARVRQVLGDALFDEANKRGAATPAAPRRSRVAQLVRADPVLGADPNRAAIWPPFGLPRPVQASQLGPAAKSPLLPCVMSRSAAGVA